MRGQILYKILDVVEETSQGLADVVEAIIRTSYTGRIGYTLGKIEREKASERQEAKIAKYKRRRAQIYLSKLKSAGLILEDNQKKLKLSKKGLQKLKFLRKERILNKRNYHKEAGERMIIVSYDLSVYFNRERDILRGILQELGFTMVHKSVWIGKVKLPRDFIDALNQMDIIESVEILEITKTGTLKEI